MADNHISARHAQIRLRELARDIRSSFEQARLHAFEFLKYALTCGRKCNEAKTYVVHGAFEHYVVKECGCSVRAVRMYMRIAKFWPEIEERLGADRAAAMSLTELSAFISKEITTKRVAKQEPADDGDSPLAVELVEPTTLPADESVALVFTDIPATVVDPSPTDPRESGYDPVGELDEDDRADRRSDAEDAEAEPPGEDAVAPGAALHGRADSGPLPPPAHSRRAADLLQRLIGLIDVQQGLLDELHEELPHDTLYANAGLMLDRLDGYYTTWKKNLGD